MIATKDFMQIRIHIHSFGVFVFSYWFIHNVTYPSNLKIATTNPLQTFFNSVQFSVTVSFLNNFFGFIIDRICVKFYSQVNFKNENKLRWCWTFHKVIFWPVFADIFLYSVRFTEYYIEVVFPELKIWGQLPFFQKQKYSSIC